MIPEKAPPSKTDQSKSTALSKIFETDLQNQDSDQTFGNLQLFNMKKKCLTVKISDKQMERQQEQEEDFIKKQKIRISSHLHKQKRFKFMTQDQHSDEDQSYHFKEAPSVKNLFRFKRKKWTKSSNLSNKQQTIEIESNRNESGQKSFRRPSFLSENLVKLETQQIRKRIKIMTLQDDDEEQNIPKLHEQIAD